MGFARSTRLTIVEMRYGRWSAPRGPRVRCWKSWRLQTRDWPVRVVAALSLRPAQGRLSAPELFLTPLCPAPKPPVETTEVSPHPLLRGAPSFSGSGVRGPKLPVGTPAL